jgi:hypothetical protein
MKRSVDATEHAASGLSMTTADANATTALLPVQALSKCVYALGAMLRKCPEAQSAFVALRGDELLPALLAAAKTGEAVPREDRCR